MYARTTTVRGEPARLDDVIEMVRDEVAPAMQDMDGCVGLSMLVDRGTGTAIVSTAWEDREAMRASAPRVEGMRNRAAELLSATPEVREWEIALLHREVPAPEGACARVVWTRGDPSSADQKIEMFRDHVLPQLSDLEGFCSVSLFIDRETGTAVGATVFRDRASLERSRDAATGIRTEATRRMGLEILDVAEFDVAHAHLRVPETV